MNFTDILFILAPSTLVVGYWTGRIVTRHEKQKPEPIIPPCSSKYHAKYSVGDTPFSQIVMCQRYEHQGSHVCNLGSGYQTVGFTWTDQESIDPPMSEVSPEVGVPDAFTTAWGEKEPQDGKDSSRS